MNENKEIMDCLKQISGQISALDTKIDNVEERLNEKIDNVEERLNEKIDNVEERLNEKIDKVEERLNEKIDKVEERLNEKFECLESALDYEINQVYLLACDNQKNIKKMQEQIDVLLLPYNDRNMYANEQISKISALQRNPEKDI